MVNAKFDEWLKECGHPEAEALEADPTDNGKHRLAQLKQGWKSQRDHRHAAAKDQAGAELKVGDLVTITFRVGGIHPNAETPDGVSTLNLERVDAAGNARHAQSCPADHVVKKA